MVASLFESTIVQSMIEGTGLSLEMAAPFGDTMVQAALHCASSNGFPFSAACAPLVAPITTVTHVKIANLIAHTPTLTPRLKAQDLFIVMRFSLSSFQFLAGVKSMRFQ